jgi:D-proline reductase (dithiol) PrdB
MLPVDYIPIITERYNSLGYPTYDWYHADEAPPWTPMTKPLAESRIGLLCTAGTYVKGQEAYYYKDDASIRRIPKTTAVEDIRFSHLTENYLPDPRRDPNCVFPIEPLRTLEAEGVIGGVAEDLLSCMGGIYSQRKTEQRLAPLVAAEFARLEVDVALLVPL